MILMTLYFISLHFQNPNFMPYCRLKDISVESDFIIKTKNNVKVSDCKQSKTTI